MKKRILSLFLCLCILVPCISTGAAALLPSEYKGEDYIQDTFKLSELTYTAGTSFDGYTGRYTFGAIQGRDGATYQSYTGLATQFNILNRTQAVTGDQWVSGGMYLTQGGRIIMPARDKQNQSTIAYTAPRSGTVTLSFGTYQLYTETKPLAGQALSSEIAIFRNGSKIYPAGEGWQEVSGTSNASGLYTSETTYQTTSISVSAGDQILFCTDRGTDDATCYAYMTPTVTYTAYCGETYAQSDLFGVVQGRGGWYAAYGEKGGQAAWLLPTYDATTATFGGQEGAGTVGAGKWTLGADYETVLLFESPLIATYALSFATFSASASVTLRVTAHRGDGTDATLKTLTLPAGTSTLEEISDIALDEDDVLALRFSGAAGTTVTATPSLCSTGTVYATSQNTRVLRTGYNGLSLRQTLKLEAYSLSLSGKIHMNFYVYFGASTAFAAERGVLLSRTTATPTCDDTATVKLTGKDLGDGTWLFTYTDIAAKEMTDTLYARAYYKLSDDAVVYDDVKECRVQDYLTRIKATYATTDTEAGKALYTLSCAMLNYGAAAQTYFDYKTGSLANSGLTDTEKQVTQGTYTDHYSYKKTGASTQAWFSGATLSLQDLPHILLYVESSSTLPSTMRVQMSTASDFATLVGSYELRWNGERYVATCDGIPPQNMRAPLYFRLVQGTTYSDTLTYSPSAYAARITKADAASATVTHALFAYTDAACAYATAADAGTSSGIELPAQELARRLTRGDLTASKTYVVSDNAPLVLQPLDGQTIDGAGITISTPAGVQIVGGQDANISDLTISNLTIKMQSRATSALTLKGISDTCLKNVSVSGTVGTAVTVGEACSGITFQNLKTGADTSIGLYLSATSTDTRLLDSEISASSVGLEDESGANKVGVYVEGNTFSGNGKAMKLSAARCEVRGNTITSKEGVYLSGVTDGLVAQNKGGTIVVDACDNLSCLLNTPTALTATQNKHLYVVSNTISGILTLQSNTYLLANANIYTTLTKGSNSEQNGDTVTDVDARLNVGADETLLPHVDKELFVGKTRYENVRTRDGEVPFLSYIYQAMKDGGDAIILAPGAYAVEGGLGIADRKNIRLCAYGAMMERQTGLGWMLNITGSDTVTLEGLTVSFRQQSCGQVYVLEKLGNMQLKVVTGAGMMNEFGNTEKDLPEAKQHYNTTGIGAQHAGTYYAYMDASFKSVEKNDDGTMTITMGDAKQYDAIVKGDVLTCRASNGGTTATVQTSTNVRFQDMTIYGCAAGFAFTELNNTGATTYYRVYDSTRNGEIIDKGTYDTYKAWEKTYGVDLEVSTDDQGRYRGSPAHIGSIDATHTTKCAVGSRVISCWFENMCDDGTNQNATHARLAGYQDNEDGTMTLTYKGNMSQYSYEHIVPKKAIELGGLCYPFRVGDRVYIYTAAGQLVYDGIATTAAQKKETRTDGVIEENSENSTGVARTGTYDVYTVTIDTEKYKFNADALTEYDLDDNTHISSRKVLVDNMSMSSNGFLFDNTMVKSIRSRGLLIKASDATIKNCSLINIGMSAIAIHYEIYWGESGVSEHLTVEKNLIQNTGYFKNVDYYSPISILGLGSSSNADDYLLYDDITIQNNKIVDRATTYAIYVNTGKNIKILNNDLGCRKGYTTQTDTAPAVYLNCVNGVTLSDNKYPAHLEENVCCDKAENVSGTDHLEPTPQSIENDKPTVETDSGAITYGHWDFGGYAIGNMNTFIPYGKYFSSGWATQDGTANSLWNSYGGIWLSKDYRYAAQTGYNAAIRYTVGHAGFATIQATSYLPGSSSSKGTEEWYAIFLNDTMVWPTAGGSYTDGSVWYLVDGNTTLEGLNAELAKIQLAVEEGDTLSFVAKRKGTEWYDFGVMPSVTVASASLRGTVDALSSNLPTNTGTSVTYQGNWKFGYFAKDSTTFNTYTYYDTRNGWITSGEDEIWGKNGGIYAKNNYLYGTTNNGVRVAIAYTVPKDGKIALTLGSFVNSIGEGITGYYGVFLDGKAVCGEGSITGDTSSAAWTAVNSSTTRREISADMRAAGTIEVKKGQTIYFVATFGAVNWAQFAALPNVIYLT